MTKRIIYYVTMPEQVYLNPNELPVPTHRTITIPLTDCPMPDKGDRTAVVQCGSCPNCKDIKEIYVECEYKQSLKDKDELERRKKGVTQVINTPPLTPNTPQKDPGLPKNVFTKK